jgi:GH25 family lysozyme M1 (1,4-beta-N-acetylmuramidase)
MNNVLKAVTSIVAAAPERAQGPDLSHWDESFDPTKASERIDFAFMKLTEGTMLVDVAIEEIWKGVKQVSVRGGYHYQRSSMSWALQANHFLKIAAKYDLHIYALDLESINNVYSDTMFADSRRIIDYWRKAALGKKVVLYTNWSTYQLFYAAILRLYPSDGKQWLEELDLWYAWPSKLFKEPILPSQRKTWTFWQKAWDGKESEWGTGAAADVNVFNGTQADLWSWAGLTDQPPVEPPVDPPVEPPAEPPAPVEPSPESQLWNATVIVNDLQIRKYPVVTEATKTGYEVNNWERFTGRLWVGNGFVWMLIDEAARSELKGKWVAVRTSNGLTRFISLAKTSTPTGSNVYRLRKWGDPIMVRDTSASVDIMGTSNFQAIGLWSKVMGFGGVTSFLRIPRADIDRLAALQVEDNYVDKVTNWRDQKMRWLVKPKGTIYYGINSTETWRTADYVEWGTIGLGYNYVTVEDRETLPVRVPSDDRPRPLDMARLAGFRKTDWGRPLAELLAFGLVHRCYCAYSDDDLGDSPKGIIYSPFWSPLDWTFIGETKTQPQAFYVPFEWLEPVP